MLWSIHNKYQVNRPASIVTLLEEYLVSWIAAERSSFALEDAVVAHQELAPAAPEDITSTIPHRIAYLVDQTVRHAATGSTRHAQAVCLILTLLLIILVCDAIQIVPPAVGMQPHARAACLDSH